MSKHSDSSAELQLNQKGPLSADRFDLLPGMSVRRPVVCLSSDMWASRSGFKRVGNVQPVPIDCSHCNNTDVLAFLVKAPYGLAIGLPIMGLAKYTHTKWGVECEVCSTVYEITTEQAKSLMA